MQNITEDHYNDERGQIITIIIVLIMVCCVVLCCHSTGKKSI